MLVLGVDDETGERLVEPALRKGRQVRVEALVDRRDRRRREAVTAQLFGDLLDLAGRDAVHAHLGKGGDQRLFGALVAFEQLGREIAMRNFAPDAPVRDGDCALRHESMPAIYSGFNTIVVLV